MKYYHECKNNNCSKPFWGRKNQLFCDQSCKAAYHNNRAAELRAELVDADSMRKAHLILRTFYKLTTLGKEPIELEILQMAEFDDSLPARIITTRVNGFKYKVIHGYGYRFTDKTNKLVMINTRAEIDSL